MQHVEKKLKKSLPGLAELRKPVQKDLNVVDALILRELHSKVEMINEITAHIIKSGGKRLRPLITLLMARALDYQGDTEHHELAAVIEFVHTATLLHDDVVDESMQRRSQPTANAVWDNSASVLAGDFLYSRAFQILARRSNIPVMKVLADTTNQISEGEVLQLTKRGDTQLSEADYFQVIRCKTAQLYSAAAEIGAIAATKNNPQQRKIAADFGMHLGLAFQMIDDLLDYTADSETTGKNLGDDLAEGKLTLPLIYTLQHGNQDQRQTILQAIKSGGREHIDQVTTAITNSNGCKYTYDYAQKEAKLALACLDQLPDSTYRESLAGICDFVLKRDF